MAPEAYDGNYDNKVDVYAFGLILYEIITNSSVLSGEGDKEEVFRKLRNGGRPDICLMKPTTESLIKRCWSTDPKTRPSFEEIWGELILSAFDLIEGVGKDDAEVFLKWIKDRGGNVDQFD
jgi:serine/threonine protein kinase